MEVYRKICSCNLCGSSRSEVLYNLNEFCHLRGLSDSKPVQIDRCGNCGLIYRADVPDDTQVAAIYNAAQYFEEDDYFANCCKGYKEDANEILAFKRGLHRIDRLVERGMLLDVGCGLGTFLDIAYKDEWKVKGVEISKYASNYARQEFGLDIFTGKLSEACFERDTFDALTMWDVIEHLTDPRGLLLEANRVLKKDGLILLFTPDERSLLSYMAHLFYRLSRGKIAGPLEALHPFDHNYFFDEKTLTELLEKSGFEIVVIRKEKAAPERSKIAGRITSLAINFLENLACLINKQFRMTVYARKIRCVFPDD